jgi:hypothetical protein
MVERERDDSAKRSNAKSRMIRRREKGGGKWEGVWGEMAADGGQSLTFEQGRNLAPRLVVHAHSPHPLVILPKRKKSVWDRDDTARIRFWHDFLCFPLLRFGVLC